MLIIGILVSFLGLFGYQAVISGFMPEWLPTWTAILPLWVAGVGAGIIGLSQSPIRNKQMNWLTMAQYSATFMLRIGTIMTIVTFVLVVVGLYDSSVWWKPYEYPLGILLGGVLSSGIAHAIAVRRRGWMKRHEGHHIIGRPW